MADRCKNETECKQAFMYCAENYVKFTPGQKASRNGSLIEVFSVEIRRECSSAGEIGLHFVPFYTIWDGRGLLKVPYYELTEFVR